MKRLYFTVTLVLLAMTAAHAQSAAHKGGDAAQKDSTETDSAYWKKFDLNEVQVTAARKYVKADIDKLTYDIERDDDSKTKNTLDMLRKVPLVTVDGQDNIKVKGSSAFKIYKNGHPDPSFEGSTVSQILKALPANSIKKIEVITDPGAKYDAEGTTAILNIVMKDNAGMHGVAGTINMAATPEGSTEPSVSLTTQVGKLTVGINYGFANVSKENSKQRQNGETYYKDSGETDRFNTAMKGPLRIHFGDISASYEIDSLNLISLSGGGYYYHVGMDIHTDNQHLDKTGDPVYSYTDHMTMPKYDYYNFNGRVDYQHKTHLDGEVLTLSYMGSTTRQNDNESHVYSNFSGTVPFAYTGFLQKQNEKFFEHTAQIDYVRPIHKIHTLEVGAKYINRSNKSKTAMDYADAADQNTGDQFKHITQVAAAYAEWMSKLGKWSLRAGLRYEYSHMKATYPDGSQAGFSKNLNDWCPSASIQYAISDMNTLRLNYSTTITRPGISFLNPAVIETPTTITYGNPELNSARNQSLALTYTHVGQKFTFNISPQYYFSNNQIADEDFARNNKQVSTYGNINRERSFWTSAYAQLTPWKGGSFSINGGAGYHWYKNPNINLALGGWHGNGYVNYTQQLPWKLQFTAGFGCNLGREPQSVYDNWTGSIFNDFSIRRSFLKEDRLTVTIATSNPFNEYQTYKSHTVQGDYIGYNRNQNSQSHQFGIRISYRFGSLKASVKKVDKSIENDDVVGGIKK
ncbi:MAG: outer membrane beta-barrel family protein [Prevotella sp.]|nr:outer membrane beta-barrel family protein [Prevotella sp.]